MIGIGNPCSSEVHFSALNADVSDTTISSVMTWQNSEINWTVIVSLSLHTVRYTEREGKKVKRERE